MELRIRDGDYVRDGIGGLERVRGEEELVQRVRYRLCARRGAFPFAPTLGRNLHLLWREKPSARLAAARLYVAEALAEEREIRVTDVSLRQEGDVLYLHVGLAYEDRSADVALRLEGE